MKFWGIRLLSIALGLGLCFLIDKWAFGMGEFERRLIVLAGLYVTLAVSLNLINGVTGQFSIGHAAFYQVGAYTAGFLTVKFYQTAPFQGLPWLLSMMVVAAVGAAVAGFIVGLPSLRLRGDYLAIVTLGFGEIIRIVVQNIEPLGGSYGLKVNPKFEYIWLVWLLALVCIAVCRNLLKTAHGLPFLAVREDEVAASAMGVNVTKIKVTAFVMGSAFAGAAGALLAHYETFISPSMFSMDLSFIILTMVVLGGTGSITGSAIAAIALYYLPERLREMSAISGSTLFATVVAIFAGITLIRLVDRKVHGAKTKRIAAFVGALAGAVVVQIIAGAFLKGVPSLANATFEAAKLRMVIFAGTLIVLMLLRPQGVFGHHEFGWHILKMFKKRVPEEAKA